MTVAHTHFYIVVYTQPGCRTLKLTSEMLIMAMMMIITIMLTWNSMQKEFCCREFLFINRIFFSL